MQFKHVTLDFDGPVAILKLDHQEVMNAVSMDMLGGLSEALDAIDDKREEVRCLVLTGAGRAFCTGANLQGRNNQKPGKSNAGQSLEIGFHPFLRRLRRLHCPIVSAVNGPAAGDALRRHGYTGLGLDGAELGEVTGQINALFTRNPAALRR